MTRLPVQVCLYERCPAFEEPNHKDAAGDEHPVCLGDGTGGVVKETDHGHHQDSRTRLAFEGERLPHAADHLNPPPAGHLPKGSGRFNSYRDTEGCGKPPGPDPHLDRPGVGRGECLPDTLTLGPVDLPVQNVPVIIGLRLAFKDVLRQCSVPSCMCIVFRM